MGDVPTGSPIFYAAFVGETPLQWAEAAVSGELNRDIIAALHAHDAP